MARYKVGSLSEIPSPVPVTPGSYEWKPVRHHFGIRAFGVNAMVASRAGDCVVEEHTEASRHEELYFVASGRARFVVAGEDLDAPAGSFVFVPDPDTLRSATALEAGTTVLAVGAAPGVPFAVSQWERKYFDD